MCKDNDYRYLGDMVLIAALGRSGSGYLVRVVGNLAGTCTLEKYRCIYGELFEKKDANLTDPKGHLIRFLSNVRKKAGPTPIIGSKWKPYTDNRNYDKAWKWVGQQNIPVILSTRNPLDVFISRQKHIAAPLTSHCLDGDEACVQEHKSVKVSINPNDALIAVRDELQMFDDLRKKFVKYHIRFFEITYEELTFGTDEQKIWLLQRVADFFVPTSRKRHIATLKDLDTDIVGTADYNQSKAIMNYAELHSVFSASPYANLLHA